MRGSLMLEEYAIYVFALGAILALVGYVWLVARAFRERALWGWLLILFPPSALVFIGRNFRKAAGPVRMLGLAAGMAAAALAVALAAWWT